MKRRSFITKSALTTTALTCSSSLWSSSCIGANNSINIGIIGTGDRGQGLFKVIQQLAGLNVVACCDSLPFRLQEGLAIADAPIKGHADYRRLLDNTDIDAVLIATPFNTHAEIAMDALDAAKHVFCEKTLVKGYDAIQKLINKEKSSKGIFQTGHQYHSSRLYSHVVNLINNGKIGKIAAFECQWNRNGNWRRPVPDEQWERQINWRMYREYSGGLLAELCSHQIDFVNWVLGEMPEQVMGIGGIDYWKDGRETYDNIHLIYSYPNGVKAKFTCLTSNAMGDYRIKVMGDKGSIILSYAKAWFYPEGDYEKKVGEVDGVSGATTNWAEGKGVPIEIKHTEPSKQALMDFRDSIVNSKPPASDAATGAKTALCVQMGLDAMYGNKIVAKNTNLVRQIS